MDFDENEDSEEQLKDRWVNISIRQNLEEVKKDVKSIRGNALGTGTIGLIALTLFYTCSNNDGISKIEEKFKKQEYEIISRDVIGNEGLEKFYEINEQRFYLEIDGKPTEDYFNKKPIQKK